MNLNIGKERVVNMFPDVCLFAVLAELVFMCKTGYKMDFLKISPLAE